MTFGSYGEGQKRGRSRGRAGISSSLLPSKQRDILLLISRAGIGIDDGGDAFVDYFEVVRVEGHGSS